MIRKFTFLLTLCMLFQMANAQVQVWGDQPGEGDFDGGLNGWTTMAENPGVDSAWMWSPNGSTQIGTFNAGDAFISSQTASNGAAIYHYDLFITGGDPNNQPDFPYTPMTGHLISPEIDLSGAPSKYLFVRFNQIYGELNPLFDGQPQFGVSFTQDGGNTWFPEIREDAGVTTAPNEFYNSTFDVNIPSDELDITQPFQIRFTFAGDYYWWAIDDVKIFERQPYETSANPFYAIAANALTPVGQMPDIGFLVDVENLGSAVAPNVVATVSIEDNSGTEVFTDQLEYGDLTQDSLAENQPFPQFFPKDLPVGTYTGTYTVASDSAEANPGNNSQSFTFRMTDTTFAKDLNGANGSSSLNRSLFDSGPWSVATGTHYYIPNGDGLFARTVSFTIDNANNNPESVITGETILVNLYKWTEIGAYDGEAAADERILIGTGFHTVVAGDNLSRVITVPLATADGQLDEIPLEDDTHYIVMLEYFSDDDQTTLYVGTSDASDFLARTFQDGLIDSTRVNYHQMLGWGELPTAIYSGVRTYGADNVPVVRLSVGEAPLFSNTKDLPTLDASAMTLSPVPANDYINIAFDLQDVATQATVEIFAADGKIVEVIDLGITQKETKVLSLDKFNAGTYYARFISKEGVLTKPFQVIR